mmetsp:Transcript_2560/g.6047  ORF Transcript_2560/g.6047 Transcript_2560/m.6047 type:complete len:103 (-) Transcript_2560:475-783(-)
MWGLSTQHRPCKSPQSLMHVSARHRAQKEKGLAMAALTLIDEGKARSAERLGWFTPGAIKLPRDRSVSVEAIFITFGVFELPTDIALENVAHYVARQINAAT